MENTTPAVKDVRVVRDVVVKPLDPRFSSGATSHPYLNALVPLTVFDLANYNCHIPVLYAFNAPMPDNKVMEDALSRALLQYPHLAGSFASDVAGWPSILLDDTGARLIETHVPTTLADNLPFDSSTDLSNLIPAVPGARLLLQIQLNRFTCGGIAIGLTFNHRVADGHAMGAFLVTWGKMAQGHDPSPPPAATFHDREFLLATRNPPRYDFPHQEIEFVRTSSPLMRKRLSGPEVAASLAGMTNVHIHYSSEFMSKLKAKANGSDGQHLPPRSCSSFQCILAHVWKKLTAARGLSPDEYTTVRAAVDGRRRLYPPAPSYFGNLVLWAFPRLKAGELLQMSYADVGGVIKHAVAQVDNAYFRSCIDFGELELKRKAPRVGEDNGDEQLVSSMPDAGHELWPDLEFNSWFGLRLTDVDFGGGTPNSFTAPILPVEGLAILMPSCEDGGGADLFIGMNKEQAQLFREIAHSIE